MDSINNIKLNGSLVELPVMKTFPSGGTLGVFKIKNTRSYIKKDGSEVVEETIVEFQTWDKRMMQKFGLWHIGLLLEVDGRVKGSSWIKEGKTINKVNFIAESISVVDTQEEIIEKRKETLIDTHIFEELPF